MIPFSPPRIDQKTVEAVREVLLSGWITTGKKTREFESALTSYCGNKNTLCVNSATSGLELMLRWFGIGPGDEVIVPAYTYCATANVVVHCGATPVFVDVETDFNIATDRLEKAITEKTKAVIPVDIGGWPCDYNELRTLLSSDVIKTKFRPSNDIQKKLNRILLLADAAHSIGAEYRGAKSGSLCDISVFSFHAVKNLTTAEGGAICLNLPLPFDNKEIYDHLKIISLHGQSSDAQAKFTSGNWRYDVAEAGYKCNMTDIQAAMGMVELSRYESDMLKQRRSIFERYSKAFEQKEWAQLPPYNEQDKKSSFHLYLLRIRSISEMQRDLIISNIFRRGVAVNVHFIPLPLLTYYSNTGYDINDFPMAYDNFSREVSLPVYYDLSDEQVNTVIKAVTDSVNEVIT